MSSLILSSLAGLLVGVALAIIGKLIIDRARVYTAKQKAEQIIESAEKTAETLKKERLLEARDETLALKRDQDRDHQQRYEQLHSLERRLRDREVNLDKRQERCRQMEREQRDRERDLNVREKTVSNKEEHLDILIAKRQEMLERTANMSAEEAIEELKESLMDKARRETAESVKEMRDKAKLEANREAKEIIVQAIQRSAVDHATENTVSVINLPNDDVKGRIIGREGRNIRALETATGVDIIVDDTPEAVILSSFDPYRREIARTALEKLIIDGRIHPGRIEEVVDKAEKEVSERVLEFGQNALLEANVHGVHSELVKYLGRLNYRTSYGQNVLKHSIEVAHLTGLMAVELGFDAKIARRAGLLHDIGKAVDRESEGTHVMLGLELAEKYREHQIVRNAIASHHEDAPFEHPISVLVQAADAISGARPGARRETLESYIKRLHKIEEVAKSFDGVNKVFAIQAGREVRVLVENDKVSDALADAMAHGIAEKIEKELEYPGQIKVTVIREYRSVEYAK